MESDQIIKVALNLPLRRTFDYLPPTEGRLPIEFCAGSRVRVSIGRLKRIGVIVGLESKSEIKSERLKVIDELIDDEPILCSELMKLLKWAADYYHHPLGEVLLTALPALLRKGKPALVRGKERYTAVTDSGDLLARAPRQRALLDKIAACKGGITKAELRQIDPGFSGRLNSLLDTGLVAVGKHPPSGY